MRLLPLLSAILALCLTLPAVGLPQQRQQRRAEQQQLTALSKERLLEKARPAMGVALGAGIPVSLIAHWLLKKLPTGNGPDSRQNPQDDLKKIREEQARNARLAEAAKAKEIVLNNPELKECMIQALHTYAKIGNWEYTREMPISAWHWTTAAEWCRDRPGWDPALMLDPEGADITIVLDDEPPAPTRNKNALPFRIKTLEEVVSTPAKGMASAFKGLQEKPPVGRVGGGMHQGAPLQAARLGM